MGNSLFIDLHYLLEVERTFIQARLCGYSQGCGVGVNSQSQTTILGTDSRHVVLLVGYTESSSTMPLRLVYGSCRSCYLKFVIVCILIYS